MEEINILKYLRNYGTFEVKVKSFHEDFEPSDDVLTSYTINGATIVLEEYSKIKIVKNIQGINQFELLIDGIVKDVIDYEDTEEYVVDLRLYEDIPKGRRTINLRAIGEGINQNLSNSLFYYDNAPIFGVSGFASTVPNLARTDDSVGLDFSINNLTGEIKSDFNNSFPWNETEIVTEDTGKFVKFPDMYFRVGTNELSQITDIAVSAISHAEGDWYLVPSFMYGCYGGSVSNSKMKSISGATRQTSAYRSQHRTYAANNGTDYFQLDLFHLSVVAFLFWIEFATTASNTIMTGRFNGSGTAGGNTIIPTGGTDALKTPSGYELKYKQMRYHYIEDFIGNVMEYVDGIYSQTYGSKEYVTADTSKFADSTTGHEQLSYTNPPTNYSYPTIATIGWDKNHPFMVLPTTTMNNSNYNTLYCQRDTGRGSNLVLYTGQCWSHIENGGGVYSFGHAAVSTAYSDIGSRLLKKVN